MELYGPNLGICLFVCMLVCGSQSASVHKGENSLDKTVNSKDQAVSSSSKHRRYKRQMGFWDRFYDKYVHIENYFPSEVDIISQPRVFNILKQTLTQRAVNYDTLPKNVEMYLDQHMAQNFAELSRDYFSRFRNLEEMYAFLKEAVRRCAGHCSLLNIGQTYEGRPMYMIKITTEGKGGPNKPKMWLDAGMHPREWVSHTSVIYVIDMLILKYDHDPYVRDLVDNYEWYIMPCANPDGYEYTWTTDRMWRKTRSRFPGTDCVGVDPNRNFDFKWGWIGSTGDPCNNNYRGPEPFSEIETRNIRDFIMAESKDSNSTWLLFITIHSKAQTVMSPWGYTIVEPGDYQELRRVGRVIAHKMTRTNQKPYRFGTAAHVLYRSAGTSRDWARGVAKIKYVYTIEMRDKKLDDWRLPPAEIIPAGEELWAGLVEGMKAIEMRLDGVEYDMGELKTTTRPVTTIDYVKKYSHNNGRRIPISW